MPSQARLLGTAEVLVDDVWQPLPGDKRGALLAYLACDGGWVARDRLAFLFWPDSPDATARRNLRQLLNRLKSLEVARSLEREAQRLRWNVVTDAARLRSAAADRDWPGVVEAYTGDLCLAWPWPTPSASTPGSSRPGTNSGACGRRRASPSPPI